MIRIILYIFTAIVIFYLFIPAPAVSQAGVAHPDGLIGQINGSLCAGYSSVSAEERVSHADHQFLGLDFGFPVSRYITFNAGYKIENVDSIFHNYFLGASFRLGDPTKASSYFNPDGVAWQPVLTVNGGGRVSDKHIKDNQYYIMGEILVPVSTYLSAGIAGKYYQDRDFRQVDQIFGRVNIFTERYQEGERYSNSDGVEGSPSFYLTGGGSSDGLFGQVDFLMPLERDMTLVLVLRGERTPSPYTRTASIGICINYYPGH